MESKLKENLSIIGVIGGVGPYAGLDFVKKIFDNTKANCDQEHLNCMLVSCSSIIPDRTGFLLQNKAATVQASKDGENPACGMFESARRLYLAGVRYAVVACNTAHSGRIFSLFSTMVKEQLPELNIINLLETCARYVTESLPKTKRVGLLASIGTHKTGVYHEYLKKEDGFVLMEPDSTGQERVHEAIYSIKANTKDIGIKVREKISNEINRLAWQGAEAVILGCTELPLAADPKDFKIPVIDPGLLAARRLISLVAPEKLVN